ncbi:uncharacterized protein METZ01_LOCUS422655, partial [marine metagenome]
VKTVNFGEPKYVGDPLNAVRIYNEKEVDELVVFDIDATVKDTEPDYQLISNLAAECRMPLCYGGGVRTIEHFEKIVRLGVEKVAVSAATIENQHLITVAAKRIGSQSLVVVIDVKKTGILRHYEVVTHNGSQRTGLDPSDFAARIADAGAGEIVVNSVDRDGEMSGYDFNLIDSI